MNGRTRQGRSAALRLIGVVAATFAYATPAAAEPFAFVANLNSETVSVIDTATNEVARTIPVGALIRPSSVAISLDGHAAYVANFQLSTVSIIDTATQTLSTTLAFGDPSFFEFAPTGIVTTPDGRLAYVTENGGRLAVIDTGTNQLVSNDPLQFGDEVVAGTLVLSRDGSHGYMAGYTSRNGVFGRSVVAAFDPANNTISNLVPLPQSAGIAVSPDGSSVYVAQDTSSGLTESGTILVLDAGTLQVVRQIALAVRPGSLSVTAEGRTLYMLNTFNNRLSALDLATETVQAIPLADGLTGPASMTLSPDGARAYVTYSHFTPDIAGAIAVIDTASNTVRDTIDLGSRIVPNGLAVLPDGVRAYVTSDAAVQAVDLQGHQISTFLRATFPERVAAAPDGSVAYVVSDVSDVVSVVDRTAGTATAIARVPGPALDVTVAPDGRFAWVSLFQGISLIDTRTNTLDTTIAVDPFGTFTLKAGAVAFTPDGRYAYVVSNNSDSEDQPDLISVIDAAARSVVATIPVHQPEDIAITPDGCTALVAAPRIGGQGQIPDRLDVIDTQTNTVAGSIPLTAGVSVDFSRVLIAPDGAVAYVATVDAAGAVLEVVDLHTRTTTATIRGLGSVRELAITPDGRSIYATSADGVIAIDLATGGVGSPIATGALPFGISIGRGLSAAPVASCTPFFAMAPTPTDSPTPTPSPSPSPTASPSATATGTFTATATSTRTVTSTTTATMTRSATATITASFSATVTHTPVSTATATPPPTFSPTTMRPGDTGGGCAIAPASPPTPGWPWTLPALLLWRRRRRSTRNS